MTRLAGIAPALVLALALPGCAVSTHLRSSDTARIQGRTYVVTGASSGFGRGVATRLGRLGANVVVAARRTAVLEEVAADVRAGGGQALVVTADVSRAEDVERLAEAAVARFGRIDVWINNAGVATIGAFTQTPAADHARVIDVNLKGVIYGTHAAIGRFVAQGAGTVVNVGSVESLVPLPYQASYSASKHGVLGLGRALNEEMRLLHHKQVKVVTVMPWAADTPFWQHAGNTTGKRPRMILMDRAQKVADAIVWASVHPREELPVGFKAQAAISGHNLFPDLAEYIAAEIYHDVQIHDAPPGANGPGNLYEPVDEGTGIEGGNIERVRAEEMVRKAAAQPR